MAIRGLSINLHRSSSTPFLRQFTQSRFFQIFGEHCGLNIDRRVEMQEPRFGVAREFGIVLHVDDHDRAAVAVDGTEIDRLGFGLFQDAPDRLVDGACPHRGVEFLRAKRNLKNESHGNLLVEC